MDKEKRSGINFTLIKRILSYSKPYKKLFILALLLTLTLAVLSIVRPLLIKEALNCIGNEDSSSKGYLPTEGKIDFINHMGLLLLGVLFIEALLQFTNMYVTNLLGQNIVLKEHVFR
jgi:ATP-binding cassette subfamily B multidrug efflux pump